MTKISIIIILLFIAFSCKSQDTLPKGLPIQKWTGRIEASYVQSDSANILAKRDTNWIPRYLGTQVIWFHAGVDTSVWIYIGKWIKQGNSSFVYFKTYSDFINYNPSLNTAAIVADSIYGGGYFVAVDSTSNTVNNGITFPTANATIVWKRQIAPSAPINVRWFGAQGTGLIDDRPKIQAAIDFAELTANASNYRSVYIPATNAYYRVDSPIYVHYYLTLFGDGFSSIIQNDRQVRVDFGDQTVLYMGNYSAPNYSKTRQYLIQQVPTGQEYVVLNTPSQIDSFQVGQLVIIQDAIGFHGGGGFFRSRDYSINKVQSIDGDTIFLEDPIGVDILTGANIGIAGHIATAPFTDELGQPLYMADHCTVKNISIKSPYGEPSPKGGRYKCIEDHMEIEGRSAFSNGGQSHCITSNIVATFSIKFVELANYTHDNIYANLIGTWKNIARMDRDSIRNVMKVGEFARDNMVTNFQVQLNNSDEGYAFFVENGYRNVFNNFSIRGHRIRAGGIYLTSGSDTVFTVENKFENGKLILDSINNYIQIKRTGKTDSSKINNDTLYSGSTIEGNVFNNIQFYGFISSAAGVTLAGENNRISNCYFEKGMVNTDMYIPADSIPRTSLISAFLDNNTFDSLNSFVSFHDYDSTLNRKVGIQTNNPTAKLDVNGTARFRDSTQIGAFTILPVAGTNGQALTTNGSNIVTWQTVMLPSKYIVNETPSGTIDGANTVFTLANTPVAGKVQVFLEGLLKTLTTDYSISGATITFVVAPSGGNILRVTYLSQ